MSGPRILIIGAGARGHQYASAITRHSCGHIVGIAEPNAYKRREFQRRYGGTLLFSSWTDILSSSAAVTAAVDGICICTLDETHAEILLALRPLGLHILCEKPLATTLSDCRAMFASLTNPRLKPVLFAVGHVLRYSSHNMLLHRLVTADAAIGEVVNINHTEPVGFWHFAHSYVRGNWRNGAPSLLTKCCHDIDLLLWLTAPHTPSSVSSHGSLVHFQRSSKPVAAGDATNCLSCPVADECIYSAEKIYIDRCLRTHASTGWPNNIVAPEIEDTPTLSAAEALLREQLSKPEGYGRCIYEADNNVVDNQVVVLSWDDAGEEGRRAKTATLTMIAHTERVCERFTKIYGTLGELTADSRTIRVFDFRTGETKVYRPEQHLDSGHGGGDVGLSLAFVDAIAAVKEGMAVDEAQRTFIKCTPEEAVRSHEAVFWAEKARLQKRVIEWDEWKSLAE